ncbi:MAG: ATP-binding protein, partial [Halobaculum sp.]
TAAPDGVAVLDENLTHVSVNPAYADRYGYDDPSELVGEPWQTCCPDGAGRFEAEIRPALSEDGEWRGTVSGHREDGSAFTHTLSVAPMDDGGVVCVVRDAEERVVESSSVLDRMTDAFFAVADDWTISYLNDEAASVLSAAMADSETEDLDGDPSARRQQIEGRNLWRAIPDAVGTVFEREYRAAMTSQEARSFEARYDPLDTWFEVRAYPSDSGLSIYFRDITDRREREAALAERERVLSEMYEVSADVDRSFDAQVEELLDIGREVLGVSYGTLSRIDGEDYVFEVISADDDSIQAGDVVPVSATNCERTAATEETLVLGDVAADAPELTDKDGFSEWGVVCYLGAPVIVDGDVYGTFCFYDDEPRTDGFSEWEITLVDLMAQWVSYERTHTETRQRLQWKNAQLERQNQRLEEFVSIVSHDLRNPLTILDGWLEQAEATGDPDHFERCYDAVERMETLIDELLTLAKAGEQITELETVDLADLAEESWDGVETAEGTLTVESTRTIRADRSRLQQVFENLLRNAVEHAGPDVHVTVSDTDDGFAVADDGPGIPEENRSEVFDAGFSTGDAGTGFGLKIVRQVADAHGWTLDVTESPEGGARFEFGDVERR